MSTSELSGAVWRKSSHSGGNEGGCVEVASVWRKSSHSGAHEDACVEIASIQRNSAHSGTNEGECLEVASGWLKSSHSGASEGSCVEVARDDRLIAVRDSKNPSGPVLAFARAEWHTLLTGIKSGTLDLA